MSKNGQLFMEGFLTKRGHVRHNWKTRWFKLSDNSLRYYKNQKHTVPHGRIALENSTLAKKCFVYKNTPHVFKVTTATGVEYPMQAPTKVEFDIWTDVIQNVINRLSSGGKVTPLNRNELLPEPTSEIRKHAKTLVSLGNMADGGVEKEARMIDGVMHTDGFSGLGLQQWMWTNMGLTGSEAEVTVSGLLRLTDESSLKSMSSTYLSSVRSQSRDDLSIKSPVPTDKISTLKHKDSTNLPKDLPPGRILKRGILFKRGHFVPSWKCRCFVLQDSGTLSYFDPSKKNRKILNTLVLRGATVFPVAKIAAEVALKMANPPDHLFCVKVASGSLYLIIATSDSERDDWIRAIKPLCHRSNNNQS
uniref:PH domain-containing protein n=1 Tax=Ciona intestinalis TaxID=7719 RepID=F7BE41_CIOIN